MKKPATEREREKRHNKEHRHKECLCLFSVASIQLIRIMNLEVYYSHFKFTSNIIGRAFTFCQQKERKKEQHFYKSFVYPLLGIQLLLVLFHSLPSYSFIHSFIQNECLLLLFICALSCSAPVTVIIIIIIMIMIIQHQRRPSLFLSLAVRETPPPLRWTFAVWMH